MAKCKYPNEVCANMTVLNGNTYCDSIPCSLKDELPKQTNADRIRSMSDAELAKFLRETIEVSAHNLFDCDGRECTECENCYLEWLQSEAE